MLAVSSKLLMLTTSVVLARWMGTEGYGVYAAAMAMVTLLTVPTALGLPTLTVRLLARYRVQGQWPLMRGFLTRSNQAVLLLSLFITVTGAIVIIAFDDPAEATGLSTYLFALALIPLMGLSALRSAALRGLHHVVLGQLPESLIMPGVFLALIGGWAWATGNVGTLSPETAIMARVIAVAAAFLTGAWLLFRQLPTALRTVKTRYEVKQWASSAAPLLFIGGMSVINSQTDVLMLAAIKGHESAGIYQAAARSAELVAFSLIVINMAIQPTISQLYAAGEMERLQRMITLAARGVLFLALPVALIMVLFGGPIMASVFGPAYKGGAACLAILSIGHLINAGAGSVGQILNMTGHERDSAFGLAIGALINVSLNAALIPSLDITGAALATCLSLAAWNIILVLLVQRRLGLDSTAFGLNGKGKPT